jgi:hypothetical protein
MGKLQSAPLDDSPYTSIISGGSLWLSSLGLVSESDRERERERRGGFEG